MMRSPDLIVTGDGSHSLLNVQLNETYHSVHGALRESRYVFIRQGLAFWCERNKGQPVVLEIGFGTGLNALLSLAFSTEQIRCLNYVTLEAYPLQAEVYDRLNYDDWIVSPETLNALHHLQWEETHAVTELFSFRKHNVRLQDFHVAPSTYDVVFFDAFAPSKQPEMWEMPVLARIVAGLKPSGVFVTYCAKGQLKRDLHELGLEVETLPGPPGKKEMVRGILTKQDYLKP